MPSSVRRPVLRALAVLALAWAAPAIAQSPPPPQQQADLRELQEMYEGRFAPTAFPGLYRLDIRAPASPRTTAPVLMTRGAEYTFNNGKLGAHRGDDGRALSATEWGRLLLGWRDAFRIDDLLHYGGDAPLRVIVVSAFDCPYSKQLEAGMEAARLRYAVIPSTIGTANARHLPGLWCAADRAAAWKAAINRGAAPPRAPAGCRYDHDYFDTFGGLLGGSKPTLLFADGTVMRTVDAAVVRTKLSQLAASGARF